MIELLHNKRSDYNNMIKEAHWILEEAFEEVMLTLLQGYIYF